tara:strand:+ start:167 stop:607 length:441 start_codon:yes stop_codon:yes gene_type:complete
MKPIFIFLSLFILNSCTRKSIECEDLLQKYAEKIPKIEFIECKKGEGQTVLEAKYKVLGKNSDEIEDILIKKFGIGKLKLNCCGWESINGKNGFIENEELNKINQNYILEVLMYGNAEKKNENDETYLELDKRKVDFYVIVKLIDV